MQNFKPLALSLCLMLGVGCGVNDPTPGEGDDETIDDEGSAAVDQQAGTAARIVQAKELAKVQLPADVSADCYDGLITSSMNPVCWDWSTICALFPERC